jgi:hypothetical protein
MQAPARTPAQWLVRPAVCTGGVGTDKLNESHGPS